MILTDTHCHLDMEEFESDRKAVLERAKQAGVQRIIIPGLNLNSSRRVINLTSEHAEIFAAIGVHPNEVSSWNDRSYCDLQNLLNPDGVKEGRSSSKVIAIGEIGLDYYWDLSLYELQKRMLKEQLRLAAETCLPVILHFREPNGSDSTNCANDLLDILGEWMSFLKSKKYPLAEKPGVLHSFSGTIETANHALDMGFYIGVGGPITYSTRRKQVIGKIPLERILIETDAPFQTPVPYQGKRNEPAYTSLIADKISEIHSCSTDTVGSITSDNAAFLFNLDSRA